MERRERQLRLRCQLDKMKLELLREDECVLGERRRRRQERVRKDRIRQDTERVEREEE